MTDAIIVENANVELLETTVPGSNGLSAYEIAVANGFVGTEQEWLDSLKAAGSGSIPGTIIFAKNGTEGLLPLDGSSKLRSEYPTIEAIFPSSAFAPVETYTGTELNANYSNSDFLYVSRLNKYFYVDAGYLGTVFSSSDGLNWQEVSNPPGSSFGFTFLADNGTYLVAIEKRGRKVARSLDGITWELWGNDLNRSLDISGLFVIDNSFYVNYQMENQSVNDVRISTDGFDWTTNSKTKVILWERFGVYELNGTFVSVGVTTNFSESYLYGSTDGINWTSITSYPENAFGILNITKQGNTLYFLTGLNNYHYTTDLVNWTTVSLNTNISTYTTIAFYHGNKVTYFDPSNREFIYTANSIKTDTYYPPFQAYEIFGKLTIGNDIYAYSSQGRFKLEEQTNSFVLPKYPTGNEDFPLVFENIGFYPHLVY